MEPEIREQNTLNFNLLNKEELLAELVHSFGTKILRLAFTYVKDKRTAEDITQEVFIRCFNKLDQFRGDSNIKTWLYAITVNLCKDYLKSWSFRKVFFNQKVPEKADHNGGVLNQIFYEAEKRWLADAVLTLSVKYREVIILHYYESYSVSEIAGILNLSENTIRTRLRRGREQLREKYKIEGGLG
jgi:RNA polymerase sigma-70 factor, ECF subfamily